jgi:hypothetical protein
MNEKEKRSGSVLSAEAKGEVNMPIKETKEPRLVQS